MYRSPRKQTENSMMTPSMMHVTHPLINRDPQTIVKLSCSPDSIPEILDSDHQNSPDPVHS